MPSRAMFMQVIVGLLLIAVIYYCISRIAESIILHH
jgi:hypothetical protein